jgi:hypothetical protein
VTRELAPLKALKGVPNDSGFYHGRIIQWAKDVDHRRVLFAGETKATGAMVGEEIGASLVSTVALTDADHVWDFNEEAPCSLQQEQSDLVITQAILEHILNPYSFMENLAALIVPGGHLITHTVMPGFPLHRFPIDTLRYLPDWFEAIAQPFDLEVVDSVTEGAHLFFLYRRRSCPTQ